MHLGGIINDSGGGTTQTTDLGICPDRGEENDRGGRALRYEGKAMVPKILGSNRDKGYWGSLHLAMIL